MTPSADGPAGDADAGTAATGPGPRFTVFTPTYNRGGVLHRVYESLRDQTYRDFEWLIVDNASTDDTATTVEGWVAAGDVPIRYLRNEVNIGRQGSWRRAIREARGELFTEVRSADGLVPQALERLSFHWDSIPDAERPGFSAVSALAMDEHGEIIGTRFPADVFDSDSIEIRYRYKVKGDKWGFQRTSVMRAQPIPEIPGYTGSIAEAVTWRAIARRYRTRYVNEPLRIYWQDQTTSLTRPAIGWTNAPGRVLEAEDRLNNDLRWLPVVPVTFARDAVAITTSGLHSGRSLADQPKTLRNPGVKALWAVLVPVGVAFYVVERFLPPLGRRLPNP
jgi:glycosyltransferase involved in cell wall biosynthesis